MNRTLFGKLTKGLLYNEDIKNKDINIIICEDDQLTKTLLVKSLNNMGLNSITMFDTTNKLYDYTKKFKNIDKNTLIILDIKMPDNYMQGDELCKLLRKEKTNEHTDGCTES